MEIRSALVLIAALTGQSVVAQDSVRVVRQRLAQPQTIGGVSCDATRYARIYSSGVLESCPLAHDTTIGSHALPRGTWVHLTATGRLRSVWLPRDWALQGHTCRGTGNQGWSVLFHESGGLALCFLAAAEVIDGVPCQRGTFWLEVLRTLKQSAHLATKLNPDGSLESCQAAKDFVLDGVAYEKGQLVRRPDELHSPPSESAIVPSIRSNSNRSATTGSSAPTSLRCRSITTAWRPAFRAPS